MKNKYTVLIITSILCLISISCGDNPIMDGFSFNPGSGWKLQHAPSDSTYFQDLFFTDKDNGWAGASNGTIIHTSDGGLTWIEQYTGIPDLIRSIFFLNPRKGWAVGGEDILVTSDGGNTWLKQFTDDDTLHSNNPFIQIVFADALNGWAVKHMAKVFVTQDGGGTWTERNLPGNIINPTLTLFNKNEAYYLNGRNIYKTSDGGNSWDSTNIGNISFIHSLSFNNPNTGWLLIDYSFSSAVYDGCPLYLTTNGGETWIQKYKFPEYGLNSIAFADENYGWISSYRNIYSTMDGGNTWQRENIPAEESLWCLKLIALDRENVWLIGFRGEIYKLNKP